MKNTPMIKDFLELVQIEVQSRNERAVADAIKKKLESLGLEVVEDDTASKVGGNAGNIIARLRGKPEIPAILFSAHMDRVKNHGHIKPVIHEKENKITSDGTSILAADNIAGVCVILDGIRKITQQNLPHGDIEVAMSVCEEVGVLGARYFDFSTFKAKLAYVFDVPGRIGRIVNQAPTKCKIKVGVKGISAHAGNEPEAGLNAIKVAAVALSRLREGRISSKTTANFGSFHAGSGTNAVCDYAEILGEARSTDDKELTQYLEEVKQVFEKVAEEYHTEIVVDIETLYHTFYMDEQQKVSKVAVNAMRKMDIEAHFNAGGGGMDGNHFNKNGIQTIGIAPGYSKNHTNAEQVMISDMMACGDLVVNLVQEVYQSMQNQVIN